MDLLIRGLEIGFIVQKAIEKGFIDLHKCEELKKLDLEPSEIDFFFDQLKNENVTIVY